MGDLDLYDRDDWSLWGAIDDCIDYWRSVYVTYWGIGSDRPPEGMDFERWERGETG